EASNIVGAPSFATTTPPPAVSSLTESPAALNFSAIAGSSAAIPQQFLQISTLGGSALLQFNATSSILSPAGGSWLQIAQYSGTAPIGPTTFSLAVSVNAAGLAPGTYLASIVVNGQDGSSHPVTVTLNVAPGTTTGGASALVIDPSVLSFAYTVGGTVPKSQ